MMVQTSRGTWPSQAPARTGSPLSADEICAIETSIRRAFEHAGGKGEQLTAEVRRGLCAGVEEGLRRLWASASGGLEEASQTIAVASRDERWRPAFGEAGILDFYLGLLATDALPESVLAPCLRIVNNTCADMPQNRDHLLKGHYDLALLRLLDDDRLRDMVLVVLSNICCEFGDYEAARKQLAAHGLGSAALRVLSTGQLDEGSQSCAYSLLETAVSADASACSDDSLASLVELAEQSEQTLDGFVYQVHAISALLDQERFRQICITHDLFPRIVQLLDCSHALRPDPSDTDEVKRLANARLVLNQAFSDVSDEVNFSERYPVGSELSSTLVRWLDRLEVDLVTCALIVLGNLARNDTVCETLVEQYRLHEKLLEALERHEDHASVAYSVLGFLKNLAVPVKNREPLGAAGLLRAAQSFWNHTALPQLQTTAVSVVRLTVTNSFANTTLFLESSDGAQEGTYLRTILQVHKQTDSVSVRIETARTVAALLRNIGLQKGTPQAEHAAQLAHGVVSQHQDIDVPLACLIEHTASPLVQGEGIIALTMLAQCCSDGAKTALRCLERQPCVAALDLILTEEVAPGKEGDANEQKLRASNKANATLLCHYLQQAEKPASMDPELRDVIERLATAAVSSMASD
ncbi:hypothetical protein KEM52_001176 [Ascosphaera acerosa]|nr:hypothetical protein KEM52_001176 [Ascosphaera acerosa]